MSLVATDPTYFFAGMARREMGSLPLWSHNPALPVEVGESSFLVNRLFSKYLAVQAANTLIPRLLTPALALIVRSYQPDANTLDAQYVPDLVVELAELESHRQAGNPTTQLSYASIGWLNVAGASVRGVLDVSNRLFHFNFILQNVPPNPDEYTYARDVRWAHSSAREGDMQGFRENPTRLLGTLLNTYFPNIEGLKMKKICKIHHEANFDQGHNCTLHANEVSAAFSSRRALRVELVD